jgi:hypothetical protein
MNVTSEKFLADYHSSEPQTSQISVPAKINCLEQPMDGCEGGTDENLGLAPPIPPHTLPSRIASNLTLQKLGA